MTGPVIEVGEVFSAQRVGEYVQITIIAPQIAAGFRPGQLVAVAVGGAGSAMVLRRTLPVAGTTTGDAHAGTISLVVTEREPGTGWLARRRAGQRLDLIGPLGTPFPMPAGRAPAVLVGEGAAAAALLPLAQALGGQGCPVEFVLGATTAAHLYGELAAKRAADRVTVVTGDGSAGSIGQPTDALPDAIARLDAQVIYACGPVPLLRAVGEIAKQHAIRAQVALTAAMACGIGVCLSCVLPVRGDDGRPRPVRACVEGPVFEAGRVGWDELAPRARTGGAR